jgi:sugar lactone lactonase YvrE
VNLDRGQITPIAQTDSEVQLQMPPHANGYAIVGVTAGAANTAYARFLYLAPRLQDLSPGFITTVAGIGFYGGEYGPATSAWFPESVGMAIDPAGRLYFAVPGNNRIMRIRGDGILEPFAGNSLSSGPRPVGQTPALDVSITFPRSIAFDSLGNLVVPDDGAYLWRVDPNGIAEIIAGTGQFGTSAPEGVLARGTAIGQPSFVAVDRDDNIYFLDWPNARVRKIDRNGILTTFAGNGSYGFAGDGGPATAAQFSERSNDDAALVFDHEGNLLLVDVGNHRIRRILKAGGTIETIIGPAINGHTLDNIRGLAVGPNNEVYFSNAAELYKRSADGTITTLAAGKRGFSPDGARLPQASLGVIYALLVDRGGNLLYADSDVARLRKIDLTTNQISTVAGTGPRVFGEGGPANAATASITGLSFLPGGELAMSWFTGTGGLFKIDGDGNLVRIAGSGVSGPLFDVPALDATLGAASVSVSRDGTIDTAGGWISRIDAGGIVRHTAGQPGSCGFSGDGSKAVDALLCQAWDAVRDASGNVFIADTNNNRVRRVRASDGMIETFAGSGPVNGFERYNSGTYCGDGGPATSACLNTPYGLAFDDRENLLVCEGGRIRRIDQSGIIRTLATTFCTKLAWAFGSVFSAGGDRVARTSRSGRVTALTASGIGFSGDGGPASQAHIEANLQGGGVAVDAEGNLFFNDCNNQRIRAIRFGAVLAPPDAITQAAAAGTKIRATVFSATGDPAEGVRVDFSAPQVGATCTLSSLFAITDASGAADVTCTPNCAPGTYSVVAQPLTALSAASVSFTNESVPCRRRSVRH